MSKIFDAQDFSHWDDGMLDLDVLVDGGDHQNRHYSAMMQKKGQITSLMLEKDNGDPYIYGIGFNGRDVFNEEQVFYYSRSTQEELDFVVDVHSDSGCTVMMNYHLVDEFPVTVTQRAGAGDQRVVFHDKWL